MADRFAGQRIESVHDKIESYCRKLVTMYTKGFQMKYVRIICAIAFAAVTGSAYAADWPPTVSEAIECGFRTFVRTGKAVQGIS